VVFEADFGLKEVVSVPSFDLLKHKDLSDDIIQFHNDHSSREVEDQPYSLVSSNISRRDDGKTNNGVEADDHVP
jgi:hypothetical protein